jgi:hypothetical protein
VELSEGIWEMSVVAKLTKSFKIKSLRLGAFGSLLHLKGC